MKTLQNTYRKNTYTYRLEKRTDTVAMYAQMDGSRTAAYEVGYIKVRKDSEFRGTPLEGGECFWANEDIGRTAWSILGHDKAMERFEHLVNNPQQKKEE